MARLRTSATGLTAVPQSRQHGKRGSSLRQSLRDRTHSGATVPSPQGTGRFPAPAPPRQDPQRCHSPVTVGNRAVSCVCPSATGPTVVPQSRHRREQGGFLRPPLRDRTHNGVTVPSPQETGRFPASTPTRQDPQRCHGPVTAGKQHCGAGLPKGWRRSRGILAQVRKNGGDLRRETASSASQWRRTQREKQTCSAWPGDLRHRQKAPAPPEGGSAPPEGGSAPPEGGSAPPEGRPAPPAGGPAPPGEGTCAERRTGATRRKTGATGRRTCATRRKTCATRRRTGATGRRRIGATRKKTCATSRRDLRRETASSASQWRRTPREKQTCSAWLGDRRHRKEDLRRRERGPAPQGADLMRTKEES